MIQYKVGNLFELLPENDSVKMICHIVNSIGAWGAGFVIPLAKAYPLSEEQYRKWHKKGKIDSYGYSIPFELGKVQFVNHNQNIVIANMVGQEGTGMGINGRPPIRYSALAQCMQDVARVAKIRNAEIFAPAFGSGLAGGNWSFIEELINELWCDRDIPVTIYSLEPIQTSIETVKITLKCPHCCHTVEQDMEVGCEIRPFYCPNCLFFFDEG